MTKTSKSSLLDKADSIIKSIDKLEKLVDNPKEFLPPPPAETMEAQPEFDKEKAEQEYFKKVDIDHPEQSPYVIKSSASTPTAINSSPKSKTLLEIEKILAEDLEEIYDSLNAEQKQKFKSKGEEIAVKIEAMIKSLKVKAKKIIKFIKEWLALIPRVNRYFLEQESKIKTQEILALARKYKQKNINKNQ